MKSGITYLVSYITTLVLKIENNNQIYMTNQMMY